jgi:hypothetical protein
MLKIVKGEVRDPTHCTPLLKPLREPKQWRAKHHGLFDTPVTCCHTPCQ